MTEFGKLLNKGVQLLSLVVFPVMTGMLILAPEIIQFLFGVEFLPAAKTLRLFSPLIIILSFGNLLCYQVLIATGKEKVMIPVYAS